jgi:hypothetical protein
LIASRSPAYHGFLRSFNGHRGWKLGKAPENRPPRYRGSGALLPGLSRRQVPILTGIDRNGRHIDAMLGRRSKDHVIDSLVDVVEPESVLCTDAFSAYEKLAERIGAEHRIFEPPKDHWLKKAIGHAPRRKGALDLWRVNAPPRDDEDAGQQTPARRLDEIPAQLSCHAAAGAAAAALASATAASGNRRDLTDVTPGVAP